MNFPKTRWQILYDYQVGLENWVENAPTANIKQFFTEIHGMIYPDDWAEVINIHMMNNSNYIQNCPHCQEILSAILTVSQINRPDLNELFVCK